MNAAAETSGRVFGIMFNQRTNLYQKGAGSRTAANWGTGRNQLIVTDWYRSQSYMTQAVGGNLGRRRRGGVLLNQAPHQLDLWQWIFGMPSRIRVFCSFGKYHDIEVEDDVTAYLNMRAAPPVCSSLPRAKPQARTAWKHAAPWVSLSRNTASSPSGGCGL